MPTVFSTFWCEGGHKMTWKKLSLTHRITWNTYTPFYKKTDTFLIFFYTMKYKQISITVAYAKS